MKDRVLSLCGIFGPVWNHVAESNQTSIATTSRCKLQARSMNASERLTNPGCELTADESAVHVQRSHESNFMIYVYEGRHGVSAPKYSKRCAGRLKNPGVFEIFGMA